MSTHVKLDNGRTVHFKYLLLREWKYLRHLKTTVEQAGQIYTRNSRMLEELRKAVRGLPYLKELQIGCPHCQEADTCVACSWKRGLKHARRLGDISGDAYICGSGSATFGGVSTGQAGVELGIRDIGLAAGLLASSRDDYVDKTVRFLRAHMDWARIVIAAGGIAGPVEEEE